MARLCAVIGQRWVNGQPERFSAQFLKNSARRAGRRARRGKIIAASWRLSGGVFQVVCQILWHETLCVLCAPLCARCVSKWDVYSGTGDANLLCDGQNHDRGQAV